jgi:uncharacterized protein (DUF2062 family)
MSEPSSGTSSFWQRRLMDPIIAQLKQGITPEKIALTLALAAVFGIFPILGATTLLCGIAAVWLRLNQPLIQVSNYLLTPLHVTLLLPFYRAGETLYGKPHVPIFSVVELLERFKAAPLQFFADYGMVGVYGITVWALIAPWLALALYFSLRPLLRRLARSIATPA